MWPGLTVLFTLGANVRQLTHQIKDLIGARTNPAWHALAPPQLCPFMRCLTQPTVVYPRLADQCAGELKIVSDCLLVGGTEADPSPDDFSREEEWHTRQVRKLTSPPSVNEPNKKTVVAVETPTTRGATASGTATGAGNRQARETPLAGEFSIRKRATHRYLKYDEDRKLDPENMHNMACLQTSQ